MAVTVSKSSLSTTVGGMNYHELLINFPTRKTTEPFPSVPCNVSELRDWESHIPARLTLEPTPEKDSCYSGFLSKRLHGASRATSCQESRDHDAWGAPLPEAIPASSKGDVVTEFIPVLTDVLTADGLVNVSHDEPSECLLVSSRTSGAGMAAAPTPEFDAYDKQPFFGDIGPSRHLEKSSHTIISWPETCLPPCSTLSPGCAMPGGHIAHDYDYPLTPPHYECLDCQRDSSSEAEKVLPAMNNSSETRNSAYLGISSNTVSTNLNAEGRDQHSSTLKASGNELSDVDHGSCCRGKVGGDNPTGASQIAVNTDVDGVKWICFSYTRNRVKWVYRIRCDIDSVADSELSWEFKEANCIYPRAMVPEKEYRGHRRRYETECNRLGWKLSYLNPDLREKRGLIQRAVDSYRNSSRNFAERSRRVRRLDRQLYQRRRKG